MPRRASLTLLEAKIRELQAKAEALKNVEKPGVKQLKDVIKRYKLSATDIAEALGSRSAGRGSAMRGCQGEAKVPKPFRSH